MSMTKAQAAAFRQRWKVASAIERQELDTMSLEEKERRLAVLMASAKALSRRAVRARETRETCRLWSRLRRRILAQS